MSTVACNGPKNRLKAGRIRRSDDLPKTLMDETESKARYPLRLPLPSDGGCEIRYRRSRYDRLDYGTVATRELLGWVCADGQRIGALKLVEWDLKNVTDEDTFFFDMDGESQEAAELAEVIRSAWDVLELALNGPLLEFRLAWMAPRHATSGVWVRAADALIEKHYAERASIMILKAFPLEYERNAPKGSLSAVMLSRRRAAMMRYYRRMMRVEAIPGAFGRDGWMWRPLRPYAPGPADSI